MLQETQTRQRFRKHYLVILAAAIALVVALAWYLAASGGSDASRRGRPAATVGTAKAALADMPVTLSAIGTVQPIVAATVRAQLSGTVFDIRFTEGQMVKKGQLLAQIDPRPYRLAMSQAQANLARDQAQLNLARVDLQRYRTLLSQDSIARQQVDTQAATVKQLEGTVGADQAAIGTARLNLEYTAISAPVSGRIGLRQADIGNYVTPGDANGIAVITQTSPIDVSFALPQDRLPALQRRLASGGMLAVQARDQSGATVLARGRFLTLDNQIDAASGTVKAKARFDNADGALFPNQFVNVTILVDTLERAVTVPVAAIRSGARGDFVFTLQPDKTAKLQLVRLGPSDGAKTAVLSGLRAGVTVITEGADSLDDGSPVTLAGQRPDKDSATGQGARHGRRSSAAAGTGAGAGGGQ